MKCLTALLAGALYLLLAQPATAQAPKPAAGPAAVDGVQTCRAMNAEQRENLNSAADMPPVVKRMGLFLASDTICSCVQRQLRASGGVVVKPGEHERLMKANAVCMSAEVNATFPPQCVSNYRELLPLMGYPSATDAQLGGVCACASKVMRERVTPDAFFRAQKSAFDAYRAWQSAGSDPGKTPAPAEDPFQLFMSELHSCASSTLGAPK
jgi:hypothetical protein